MSSTIVTVDQIAQFLQLRKSIDDRVTAIYNIWNWLRFEARNVCRIHWEGIKNWYLLEKTNEVSAVISTYDSTRPGDWTEANLTFPTTLLQVHDDDLKNVVKTTFNQWLEKAGKAAVFFGFDTVE